MLYLAIEEKPMRMADYIQELDAILKSTKRKLLTDVGSVGHQPAEQKSRTEYKKYKAKTLSAVEESYLASLKQLEQKIQSRKKPLL